MQLYITISITVKQLWFLTHVQQRKMHDMRDKLLCSSLLPHLCICDSHIQHTYTRLIPWPCTSRVLEYPVTWYILGVHVFQRNQLNFSTKSKRSRAFRVYNTLYPELVLCICYVWKLLNLEPSHTKIFCKIINIYELYIVLISCPDLLSCTRTCTVPCWLSISCVVYAQYTVYEEIFMLKIYSVLNFRCV